MPLTRKLWCLVSNEKTISLRFLYEPFCRVWVPWIQRLFTSPKPYTLMSSELRKAGRLKAKAGASLLQIFGAPGFRVRRLRGLGCRGLRLGARGLGFRIWGAGVSATVYAWARWAPNMFGSVILQSYTEMWGVTVLHIQAWRKGSSKTRPKSKARWNS